MGLDTGKGKIMTAVSMSTKYGVSAKKLWDMIGGFHAISDWHPAIEKCDIEEDGNVTLRRLHLVGGGEIVERLEQSDDDERSYSYSIISSPLPLSNYNSTIRVLEGDDGNPVPATSEGFASLPDRTFLNSIINSWIELMVGVPDPLEAQSPSGSMSEAGLTPVAAQ